jgi:hypothetical protein
MPRYRIEVIDTFAVAQVHWLELDAASLAEAHGLVEEAIQATETGPTNWATLPGLAEARVTVQACPEEESWEHSQTECYAIGDIPALVDARQTTLFGETTA